MTEKAAGRGWAAAFLAALGLLVAAPALAQQKSGPGVPATDSLTWNGITLYGVVDIGLQYDTHMAPFTPYRPAASGNIVRSNSYRAVLGLTPSNMGQSRLGLQGNEPLTDDLAAVFQIETFFNPQSGELADSVRSVTANNGKAAKNQSVGVDGSSAGQLFQTAWLGLTSRRFGTLTFGRQQALIAEGMVRYDPNQLASAFGLLGASNTYAGAGSNEDNRLDSTARYLLRFGGQLHLAGLYRFNSGSQRTAVQANGGATIGGLAVDGYYSQVDGSITGSSLSAAQVATLPAGYDLRRSLAGTVSDNKSLALMGLYRLDRLRLFAGYENIVYSNPRHPLAVGFGNIGGYVLPYVNNTAYNQRRILQVYWSGVRYAANQRLDLVVAWYGVHQSAFGTGALAGCSSDANSKCRGDLQGLSFTADYRFNVHFDVYLGAMYSQVRDGLAAGYLYTNNVNPTVGARYRF
ncbi:MAG: porin [Proteobacteria bacterium]|nr:porin [Pseudomonadota bacterium]